MTRVALYIRVSSAMQRDNWSIPAQRRMLAEECEKKGYQVAGEYVEEESAHGEAIAERPQFAALLEAVKRRCRVPTALRSEGVHRIHAADDLEV